MEDDFKWKFDEIKTKNILNNAIQFNIDWNVITLITCSSCGASIENTDNILRKVTNRKRDNHIKRMNTMGHNVPSLDVIVNTLASLKKVRKASIA